MGDLCIVHSAVLFTRNEMEWDKLIMENKGAGQYREFSWVSFFFFFFFWQSGRRFVSLSLGCSLNLFNHNDDPRSCLRQQCLFFQFSDGSGFFFVVFFYIITTPPNGIRLSRRVILKI